MVQRIVDLADDEAEVQCRREDDEEGKDDFFEIHDVPAQPNYDAEGVGPPRQALLLLNDDATFRVLEHAVAVAVLHAAM